jgi:hypothetical protein
MNCAMLAILVSISACAFAQSQATTGPSKTTAPCSPAVSGHHNTFKIQCHVDAPQGQEMVDLLNKILANQIDGVQVMNKLDEILAMRSRGSTGNLAERADDLADHIQSTVSFCMRLFPAHPTGAEQAGAMRSCTHFFFDHLPEALQIRDEFASQHYMNDDLDTDLMSARVARASPPDFCCVSTLEMQQIIAALHKLAAEDRENEGRQK